MAFLHGDTARGGWHALSLAEQLGNIGSEVYRARRLQGKDETRFLNARDRALELFHFTLSDPRWAGRLKEIGRMNEIFCDAVLGGAEYGTSLQALEPYFDRFAIAARSKL